MDKSKVPGFLKELRANSGLTQSEFAEKVGVTLGAVQKWEAGHSAPHKRTMIAIMDAFTGEDPGKPPDQSKRASICLRNVAAARKSIGWKQEDLAAKLGISRVSVARYETGHQALSIDLLCRIAEVTGRPVSWFFEEDESPADAGTVSQLRGLLLQAEAKMQEAHRLLDGLQ